MCWLENGPLKIITLPHISKFEFLNTLYYEIRKFYE